MGFHYKRPEYPDRNPVWESVKVFLYFWESIDHMSHTGFWEWESSFIYRIFWDSIRHFLIARLHLSLGSAAISAFHTVPSSISGC